MTEFELEKKTAVSLFEKIDLDFLSFVVFEIEISEVVTEAAHLVAYWTLIYKCHDCESSTCDKMVEVSQLFSDAEKMFGRYLLLAEEYGVEFAKEMQVSNGITNESLLN